MTWFYDAAGQKLYIHRGDGKPVRLVEGATTAILRRVSNFIFTGANQCSLFFRGEGPADGIDLEGGAHSPGAGSLLYTSSSPRSAGKTLIFARNCSFRYAGSAGEKQNSNGASLNNFSGLAYFDQCDFSGNATDGFNVHDTRKHGSYALTVNCTGVRNGLPGSVSCNGWTTHEGVIAIDVAGYYAANHGYNVHTINTTRSLMIGTTASQSLGDRAFGGAFDPGEFRTSDAAQMWCVRTRAIPAQATATAYLASEASNLRKQSVYKLGGITRNTPQATISDGG
jgi:hypothetical protein